jgi:Protein of unknown function (DUF2489)
MSLPEIILASNRKKAASIARCMLDGTVGIIQGSRQLVALCHAMHIDPYDSDFLPLIGIESATDHLPLGDDRRRWSAEALAAKDAEAASSEQLYREDALSACRRIVVRFADAEIPPEAYDHYTPET